MSRLVGTLALAGTLAVIVAFPGVAGAQAGYYLIPSLSLTESYDDNIFGSRSRRQSDFVTRIFPGLTAGYRSEPLTLLGRYVLGAEIFADHDEETGVNNHRVELDFRYLPTRSLTLTLNGSYTRSESTSPFVPAPAGALPATAGVPPAADAAAAPEPPSAEPPIPGIDVQRRRTTEIVVAPAASYSLTARTSIEAGYAYTDVDVSGSPGSSSHDFNLALAYQVTPLDRVAGHYRPRVFESDPGGTTTSHAVTIEYQRELTPRTTAALEVGPRLSDGSVDAEVSARLTHRFQQAMVSLAYAHTEAVVAGRAGAQTTDSVYATLDVRLTAALAMQLRGSLLRAEAVDNGAGDVTVYAAGVGLAYRFTDWLVGRAGYRFSLQDESPGQILHHVVVIGIDLYYPIRLY